MRLLGMHLSSSKLQEYLTVFFQLYNDLNKIVLFQLTIYLLGTWIT